MDERESETCVRVRCLSCGVHRDSYAAVLTRFDSLCHNCQAVRPFELVPPSAVERAHGLAFAPPVGPPLRDVTDPSLAAVLTVVVTILAGFGVGRLLWYLLHA